MATRKAQHPQQWCDQCNDGDCTGEHFTAYRAGSIGGAHARTNGCTDHAEVPYVGVGAAWSEYEREYCIPSIYFEVSAPGSAFVDLSAAMELRDALDEAIQAVQKVLSTGHILCTCENNTLPV